MLESTEHMLTKRKVQSVVVRLLPRGGTVTSFLGYIQGNLGLVGWLLPRGGALTRFFGYIQGNLG